MKPERLAELEAYYSQDDDLFESHGAVLELVFEVKRLQDVARRRVNAVEELRAVVLDDLAEHAFAETERFHGHNGEVNAIVVRARMLLDQAVAT